MLDSNVAQLEQLGFKLRGSVWLGMSKGFFFKVRQDGDIETQLVIECTLATGESHGSVVRMLNELQSVQKIQRYSIDNGTVDIHCTALGRLSRLDDLIRDIAT